MCDDICGYCGKPGADKMALWTGGGRYWPGEFVPKTKYIHPECEREETERAFRELSQEEIDAVLGSSHE